MKVDCLFCTICNKKTNILYENEHAFVIADKFPLSLGHLLVIPKSHCAFLHEMNDTCLRETTSLIRKVVKTLDYKKYNILQNNNHIQSIFHVHFHIIPCLDQVNSLKVNWITIKTEENVQEELFEKIRSNLLQIDDNL